MANPDTHNSPPQSPQKPPRRRSLTVRLILLWAVALAMLGVYWYQLLGLHAETRAQAQQEIRSHTLETAHTLSLEVDRLARQMDFLTQRLAFDWSTQAPAAFLENVALAQEALASASGTTFEVHIADAQGQVLFSSVLTEPFSPPDALNVADREYFWRQSEQSTGELWIGAPFTGQVTQEQSIPASRAIYNENGEFAGVVMISLPSRELSAALDQIFPDARDGAAIVLDNGALLARTQGDAQRTDDELLSTLARLLLERSPWGSEAVLAPDTGDADRLYAWYRTPSSYPMAVLIGRDEAAAMKPTDALIASSLRDGALGSLALVLTLLLATWFMARDHLHYVQMQRLRERQQLALYGGGLGAWDWDIAQDIITCDELCLQQLGLTPEQMPRTRSEWLKRAHPDDQATLEAMMSRGAEPAAAPQLAEVRLLHASAQWHWFAVLGKVVQVDARGKPRRMAGTLRDITTDVRREQLHRVLLDESQSAIVLMTAGREVLEANQRAREIFLPAEGASLPSIRELHLDEASYDFLQQQYEVMRNQHYVRLTWPLIDGKGERRWFDMHGVLRDPNDSESEVVWTLNDITDMHLATSALARERQRLITLLERYPGGVIVEDEDATIALVNARLTQLFDIEQDPQQLEGLSHEELCQTLGEPYATWLLPASTPNTNEHPADARREREVVTPAGRFLQVECVPVTAKHERLGQVWLFRDITERKRNERRLARLAHTDELTGLPNRRSFMEHLRLASDASDWSAEQPGAVLMIDVDHFKHINDTHGHASGDAVLQQLAAHFSARLREGDIAARLGGEEFAVLLPRVRLDDAEGLADRLRAAVAAQPFQRDDGEVLRYTISVGVAGIAPGEPEATLRQADRALYEAKRAGRNRVRRLVA